MTDIIASDVLQVVMDQWKQERYVKSLVAGHAVFHAMAVQPRPVFCEVNIRGVRDLFLGFPVARSADIPKRELHFLDDSGKVIASLDFVGDALNLKPKD